MEDADDAAPSPTPGGGERNARLTRQVCVIVDEGDAIALDVASEKASYAELVEWIIPDNRNPNGVLVQDYEIQQNPEKYQQVAWDAMKFKNPFGGYNDGVETASFVSEVGRWFKDMVGGSSDRR